MSKRPALVDFGPVSLPVHSLQDSWDSAQVTSSVRDEDAQKLQRLIADDAGRSASIGNDEMGSTIQTAIHPRILGSHMNSGANALHCLRLAASIAASSTSIATRVELTLNPTMLPQSSLIVERTDDGLCFDLHVQLPDLLDDLSLDLQAIAGSIGSHLQLPVKLRLFGHSPPILVKVATWGSGIAC